MSAQLPMRAINLNNIVKACAARLSADLEQAGFPDPMVGVFAQDTDCNNLVIIDGQDVHPASYSGNMPPDLIRRHVDQDLFDLYEDDNDMRVPISGDDFAVRLEKLRAAKIMSDLVSALYLWTMKPRPAGADDSYQRASRAVADYLAEAKGGR